MGYLWLNVRGRYLRQRLLAQALHMAARRPTLLILVEAQSRAGPEDPPFQDYARHVVLPDHGKTGAGLEVYVRTGTTTRASLLCGAEDANALLMEVLTPWGRHHVLAAHAPQISIGVEPYVRWWAAVWREVTCLVDLTTALVVADTNSAARPADRGTPRPEDTGYRTFLRAFNLTDLVDLHPVPQDAYSCFQGAARSRIDTAACYSEAQFTIASYHYWASTLLSDHHVPLLLTIAFPVNRLDKPSPHTVSRTPEYHLGPVALSPADTADFHNSILRRRALDPQLAPFRWLKGLQRAIYDWAHATGRVRALRFRQYRLKTRPAERAPPSRAPQQPFPARSMLPTVGRFTVMAQSILGTSVTAGHALKRSLVALGEAQRQHSLRGVKRRALRRKQETLNLKRTPEQWREVQRRSRGPPRDVSEIPLDSKALLNPRETLSALYLSRLRLQGHSYRIREDPDRWAHFQMYLGLLPQHAPPARGDYVQPHHLWEVQSGKARGPDLRLPEADIGIDISWYRHLTEADQKTLCTMVRSPPVSRTVGRRGRVTLLLKNPDQPVQEANLRGITISSHVSKLEPTAFYAVATAVYERALGGPCLVGGMRGISLREAPPHRHRRHRHHLHGGARRGRSATHLVLPPLKARTPGPRTAPDQARTTPGSTSSVPAPLPTLDDSPHTTHAPLPPPPRVPAQPRGRDRTRTSAGPHTRAPPLPTHPPGTGLRGIPQARHRHRSPRPRHTHPRPLLRPRPQARPGTVVAALDPHAALGAAKVGPGRALPRGPGPSAPQGVGEELLPPAGGGVDAAGRMGSHAGRCAPPPGSPPPQPPRAPGPPVCPQAPAGEPPGNAARRHPPVGHHPKPSPAQTHPLTTPQASAHRHWRHPQHPRSPARHTTRRA